MTDSFPPEFLERLAHIVPNIDVVLASMQEPRPPVIRINTLKLPVEQGLSKLDAMGIPAKAIFGFENMFSVPVTSRQALVTSELFNSGAVYIQGASSQLPPLILKPKPGMEVLDLAAAPGSKTTQMAAMMQNQGRIAAVEVVKARYYKLKANIEQQGASIVHCYNKDGARVGRQCPAQFDAVLLDAPCSSEGRFLATEPDSYRYWSLNKIKSMQRKQKMLMYSAVQSLKPGGLLLYSTCTSAPEENEVIVQHALKKFPGQLQVLPINLCMDNLLPGLLQWQNKKFTDEVALSVRVLPSALMEGFYLCLLQKME